MIKKYFLLLVMLHCSIALAGDDRRGTIARVHLNSKGDLWLKMNGGNFEINCKPGWYGFSLFIPHDDPNFPFYYGLITSAMAKGQELFVANLSVYDGSTACDITKTGYGLVVLSE